MSLETLLRDCTVKLSLPSQGGWGTGFFVAPGLILTCAHVVKKLTAPGRVRVRWQQQVNFAEAEVVERVPELDLALLKLLPETTDLTAGLPCVCLDEELQAGQEFYFFGYPDQDFDNGCPVTGSYEGLTGDVPPLIKFKLAQVRPGMSGSALLNRQTGKVCGMVKFTRGRASDLGGGAIPASVILQRFPQLRQLQQDFHQRDRRWDQRVQPDLGAIDTVKELPPNFLPRPEDIAALKERLLTPANQTLVMTGQAQKVGLQGMGGLGKTVLAAALARDNEVRRQFPDGIIWLTVGINPDCIALYQRIATTLGEPSAYQEGEPQWNAYLSKLLREKRCLLVLDDVWIQREAERFVEVLGPDCRLLLTTRDARLIAGLGANGYQVGMLDDTQARQLLANWARVHVEMLPPEAEAVRKHCRNLPLALKLAGAQVGMGTSWADLVTALDAADLRFLDHPDGSIYKVIETSVQQLDAPLRQAYLELGIVAPDVEVSEAALVKLWGRQGEVPDYRLRQWLTELAQRALVFLSGESPSRWMSLHDVPQKYLREQVQNPGALHRDWLRSYGGGKFPWTGAEVAAEVYLYQQALYHFREAGEMEAFRQLLWDFDWLQGKLEATDIRALLADFEAVTKMEGIQTPLNLIESAIHLSTHVLVDDKTQLAGQLLGRLLYFVNTSQSLQRKPYRYFWERIPKIAQYLPKYSQFRQADADPVFEIVPEIETLLNQAKQWQGKLSFRCLSPTLNPAGTVLLRTLTGHSDWVTAVAISPDGQKAVSGSRDKTLKVWDLAKGEELYTLSGHNDSVYAVAITPDGQKAVSRSGDKTLKVWDLARGELLHTFCGHNDWVNAVAITPDGKIAVSGSSDKTLKVWNLATGEELHNLTGHNNSVNAVAITPDGKIAVSGSSDKTLKVWNLVTGEELHNLTGHNDSVNAVAITPDGQKAVSGSSDKTLKLWDLATGLKLATLTGNSDSVKDIAITPDGKQAVLRFAKTVKSWDIRSGEEVHNFHRFGELGFFPGPVAITPDGKQALTSCISCSWDHQGKVWNNDLRLWDLKTGSKVLEIRLLEHSEPIDAVAITPDGKHVVSASRDKTLKLWDLATRCKVPRIVKHSGSVKAVAITPDGKNAVSASIGVLTLWDVEAGVELGILKVHNKLVEAVAITPDGKQAMSASSDKSLKLWNLTTGSWIRNFAGHNKSVRAVAITPDGKKAVSASSDKSLKLWNLTTGSWIRNFAGHNKSVTAVAITPDSKKAISASGDTTLKLWNLATGKTESTLTGHSSWVRAVAITPDGKQAVSASSDSTLKLWDLRTGAEVVTLRGHSGSVNAVAITPDGKQVVSASSDKTLKLWNLASAEVLATFTGDADMLSCAIAPDGVTVVVGDQSGRVHFLRLEGFI